MDYLTGGGETTMIVCNNFLDDYKWIKHLKLKNKILKVAEKIMV